mmetsp:Transcript_21229/g.20379  ORF Transcript_21229/g.20379 Transcript_21229/m.20379 type:complete len:99 (-) Transcript_21229:855-1151(-)
MHTIEESILQAHLILAQKVHVLDEGEDCGEVSEGAELGGEDEGVGLAEVLPCCRQLLEGIVLLQQAPKVVSQRYCGIVATGKHEGMQELPQRESILGN